MTTDDFQARWLIARSWVSDERIAHGLQRVHMDQHADLADVLVADGQLTRAQAHQVRDAYRRTIGLSFLFEDEASAGLDPILTSSGKRRLPGSRYRPPSTERLVGRHFVGYEILEVLSRSSYAVVTRARSAGLRRDVALKMFVGGDSSEAACHRFERGARFLSGLQHPNIVRVLDYGSENEIPYFVMDYLRGKDLDLRYGGEEVPPPIEEVVGFLGPIAKALAYCHSEGLMHRDVKPSNIVIDEETDTPVIVDFDLVKHDEDLARSGSGSFSEYKISASDEIVGTPAFMAPEQLDPSGEFGEVGAAADVWGIGATLHFCLTGKTLFGSTETQVAMVALVTRSPERLRKIRADVPRWLERLCASCLQRQANLRPSMAEVAAALAGENRGPELSPLALVLILAAFLIGIALSALALP